MCGISGIISRNKVDVMSFIKMNQTIHHRGPDDEGFVFFDNSLRPVTSGSNDTAEDSWISDFHYSPKLKIEEVNQNYRIAMGHRRLSILDLSPAGHMPMCDDKEELWITYNGEVYNFIEIRTELETLGHTFSTTTDTEVILAAYKEWGEKCLDRFMGMFAIAILDVKNKTVFLARDRFGIKPL
ncbi:MAG: asparagine synthetase B, partial [Bacteroidota bacterium]